MPKSKFSTAGANTGIDPSNDPNWRAKAIQWSSKKKKEDDENGPHPIVQSCWDNNKSLSIPTSDDFEAMMEAYVVAKEKKKELGKLTAPAEIKLVDNQLGLFATSAIPKGTQIYQSYDSYGQIFYAVTSYKRFLTNLEPQLQCFALLWSYIEDGHVYTNIGENAVVGSSKQFNVKETEDGSLYATKDIVAGQELLTKFEKMDYESLQWFHDLREEAWGDDEEEVKKMTISHKTAKHHSVIEKMTIQSSKSDFSLRDNNSNMMKDSAKTEMPRHMVTQLLSVLILCVVWSVPYLRRKLRTKESVY